MAVRQLPGTYDICVSGAIFISLDLDVWLGDTSHNRWAQEDKICYWLLHRPLETVTDIQALVLRENIVEQMGEFSTQ